MVRNADMVVIANEGMKPNKPDWTKYFFLGGTDCKVTQHECLYEGKEGYKKLRDHVIFAQATIKGPKSPGDTYKDIENTPTDTPVFSMMPREKLIKDNKLWRYLTRFKFEDLIKSSTLFFARLDQFTDNLEGIAPFSSMKAILCDSQKNREQKLEAVRLYRIRMLNNRKSGFAVCWHLNTKLNYQMWDAYGHGSTESLCIQTDPSKLENILAKNSIPVLNEPIQYFDEPYFNQNVYWFPTLFKRSRYKNEQEFRSIIFGWGYQKPFLKVRINLQDMVNKIYLHPNASKSFSKQITQLVKSKRLNIPIIHPGK
ncbi:MAG: hypothetical protein ABI675_24295 [Chitinophagaceae bacterium]